MIETMLEMMMKRYDCKNAEDSHQALREIMQEITLAGLYRGGFFKKAAFYGGTALRIFYQLERFSEDLDFSLLKPDASFSLAPYFPAIQKEFYALGIDVDIKAKKKRHQSVVESAFLKTDTSVHILQIQGMYQQQWSQGKQPLIKIKFEIDTQPPLGFVTEEKLLLYPFSFYVKCYQISDLFAGKLHALLYRQWKNRIKGRDWYDFEWYVRQQYPVHLSHFLERAHQSGNLLEHEVINLNQMKELVQQRIQTIDFEQAKQDIFPFIAHPQSLEIWSAAYFSDLVLKLRGN